MKRNPIYFFASMKDVYVRFALRLKLKQARKKQIIDSNIPYI